MTRSLKGKWFHNCYNNGVDAVVSNEVYTNMRKKRMVEQRLRIIGKMDDDLDVLPHIPELPIFTFARKKRVLDAPWFTGTSDPVDDNDLTRLLNYITRNEGQFGSASFNVPFSNGAETGLHGPDAQIDELRYVTTSSQFEETFGISLNELRALKVER